jgi:hypothetical protein
MDGALGPGYDYWKNIKTPSELGMSDAGTIKALSNDVSGLISYVSVLVDGNSNASKTGEPLGNRFLLKTVAKCRNVQFDKTKPESEENPKYASRYIYVDNVPDGTIPFIASGPDGGKMKDFKGLIPGAIGNLSAFSPSGFYRAFTMGNYPDCIKISLRTKHDNNDGVQTEYVAVGDIMNEISPENMPSGNPINSVQDPCSFRDYLHPITKIQKTRDQCDPTNDGFSMLFKNSGSKNSGSDLESDSDSDLPATGTASEKEERRALKHMRKMRRVEKKLHQSGMQHRVGMPMPESTPTHNDMEFTSKYDDMRFDDTIDDIDMYIPENDDFILPDDVVSRLYYATITGVGLYILYRLLYTTSRRK